jgi:putative glutamine amidotransferase
MKKRMFIIGAFILLFISPGIGLFHHQERPHYFDEAAAHSKEIRLVILYPSLGSIRNLLELRKQKLIPQDNITVVGIYHQKQLEYDVTAGGYERAMAYVRDHHLDWIEFHELSGDLDPEKLFQKNSLSEELERIFARSDGIIFFGGADIPPSVYGEKTSLLTDIATPYRSYLDTTVAFHLLGGWQEENFEPFLESHPEFPVLAFCLGLQSLNAGAGGTLFQDIPSEIYHKKTVEDILTLSPDNWHQNPYSKLHPRGLRSCNMHRIRLAEKGKFVQEWGFSSADRPFIYSSHHQAVRKLGKGLKVIATSVDGKVPEAVGHETFPNVLGVQFHPEASSLWDKIKKSKLTPDDEEEVSLFSILENNPPSLAFHRKIWSWFVEKMSAYHKSRQDQRP